MAYFYSQRGALAITGALDLEKHEGTILLGACGFLYCYIASAPFLVFHVARPLYLTRRVANKFDTVCSIALMIVGGAINLVLTSRFHVNPFFATASGFSVVIWLMALTLAFRAYFKRDIILDFYTQLTRARARDQSGIVESYHTMWEHGNAFYILISEVVLASIINAVVQIRLVADVPTAFGLALSVLALWLGPASVAWYVAAGLEIDFSG